MVAVQTARPAQGAALPAGAATRAPASLEQRVWALLDTLPDPEIPVITLTDLGIIRHVQVADDGVEVGVSPTYTGCPATEMIRRNIREALAAAGIAPVRVVDVLFPPWSTDWISERGTAALRRFGIAPPQRHAAAALPPACPRCGSTRTERVSEFGSTPCKALFRCNACLEPFEQFKCI
ncbi:MAG: phenylacetate-CoA oxygenase subunit PaaJ [Proteobacteria bacterium]|nr:phenylacetate-CoA oxygenase subunit PaaJ [Pseudomonadota bacterium]